MLAHGKTVDPYEETALVDFEHAFGAESTCDICGGAAGTSREVIDGLVVCALCQEIG